MPCNINKTTSLVAASSIFKYSVSMCVIVFGIKGFLSALKFIFNISDIHFRERLVNDNLDLTFDILFSALILAPILETLFFQSIFYSIYKYFKLNKWVIIMISSIAFGIFHNYSLFFIIQTSIVGAVFMYMYILRGNINKNPFISTVFAHFALNLVVTISIIITNLIKKGTIF